MLTRINDTTVLVVTTDAHGNRIGRPGFNHIDDDLLDADLLGPNDEVDPAWGDAIDDDEPFGG